MMLVSQMGFRFAVKKAVGQPGIIVDPESFRKTGLVDRALHWFRNGQTFGDMERHLADFSRSKSHTEFLAHNNKLLEAIHKGNFKDT
jgi:hypothetical protein